MSESGSELAGQRDSGEAALAVAGEGEQGAKQKVYRRLGEALSEEQQRALGMLMEGTGIREVGQQLGIHRGTVYRWLRRSAHFRAAYNGWQLEQQESGRAALIKAGELAVKKVIESLPYNTELAWRLVKELGLLQRSQSLGVDPSRVQMEIAVERHEEESVLLERIEREVDREDVLSPRGELKLLLSQLYPMGRRDRGDSAAAESGGEPKPGAAAEALRE